MKKMVKKRRRVIALRGNYHESNFGDDALLLAVCALLRRDDHELVADGAVACLDERLGGLRVRDQEREGADLIVYGGGTQFFAFESAQGAEAGVRSSLLARLLRKLARPSGILASMRARRRFRRDLQTPAIAIGLGIGPFASGAGAAEAAVAGLVRRMKMAWVRDGASREFCRRHGIPACVAGADLCFTAAFASALGVCLPFEGMARPDRKKVGIVLRDWSGLPAGFFGRMIEVAAGLRAANIDVQFFSFCPGDVAYLAALADAGETVLAWDSERGPVEVFWSAIADCDLVLTSRFHGAIFALLSARPFLAITIEPKLEGLAEMVPGVPDVLVAPDEKFDEILARILGMLTSASALRPALLDALARQRELARNGERALAEFIDREFST